MNEFQLRTGLGVPSPSPAPPPRSPATSLDITETLALFICFKKTMEWLVETRVVASVGMEHGLVTWQKADILDRKIFRMLNYFQSCSKFQ